MSTEPLKKLRVFVASPSDVANERAKVETVVASLKRLADRYGVTLETIDWRKVVPDMGRPQQVIFDQLKPETWDVFIGILWHRFGTPPGGMDPRRQKEYLSGTEEEFRVAHGLWQKHKKPRIMMYRCIRPINPGALDPDQLKRVDEFFKQFDANKGETPGLYQQFDSTESFEQLLRENLTELLLAYEEKGKPSAQLSPGKPPTNRLELWLSRRGLIANPFAARNAERDPDLPSYFIDMGLFDDLLDLPDPCIIYAARGGGKTALRRMLAAYCRPEQLDSQRLAFPFTSDAFQRILAAKRNPVPDEISDYVPVLMYYGLTGLMQARNDPKVNNALASPDVAPHLEDYLAHFAPHLSTRANQPSGAVEHQTPSEIWRGFGELVTAAGLKACLVLVDALDEVFATASDTDQLIDLLAPLLATLSLIECPGVAFRFFVPLEIETLLRACQWYRPDRIQVYRIQWDKTSIAELIGKRLSHYSQPSGPTLTRLGQLCTDDFAHQIDNELAELAGGQPRAALILADTLLRIHCEQPVPPERITSVTWKIVKERWPSVRADFFKEEQIQVPSAPPSMTTLPVLRVEDGCVWLGNREVEDLTALESRILECLYKHREQTCSHDLLWKEAWQYKDSVSSETIAAAMTRVRRKLGQEKPERGYIKTIIGKGFRLYPEGFES